MPPAPRRVSTRYWPPNTVPNCESVSITVSGNAAASGRVLTELSVRAVSSAAFLRSAAILPRLPSGESDQFSQSEHVARAEAVKTCRPRVGVEQEADRPPDASARVHTAIAGEAQLARTAEDLNVSTATESSSNTSRPVGS